MSNVLDTLFGDGTPSEDASSPLATFGRLFSPLATIEILSTGLEGGLASVSEIPTVAPTPGLDVTEPTNMATFSTPKPMSIA